MTSQSFIRAESLTDQVYSLLEREIVEGRMKPGERIREKELAQRLGISRTPIREALLKLEMAGIVVCNSRRSYNVRILTAADISEVFEILGILEGAAVTSLEQNVTEQDLALLEQYNEKMAETAKTRDFHTFGAWNEKFHDVLLSKSKNRSLLEVCDSIRRRIYVFPVRPPAVSHLIGQSVREHLEIIRLARAKDLVSLGAYFREVHWNYRVHLPYVEEVFAGPSVAVGEDSSQPHRLEKVRGARGAVKQARRSHLMATKS
jgi:DNA-binding GntR family transcriptional regulator